MTLIWHDDEKAKRLSRSQPLRIDWLIFWTWVAALLLGTVWLRILYLAAKQFIESL